MVDCPLRIIRSCIPAMRKRITAALLCLALLGTTAVSSGCIRSESDSAGIITSASDGQISEDVVDPGNQDHGSTEILTGTGWWDNDEASRDYTLSGDGYMVFEIYVSPDNDKASNAYCVEAYDDGQHYLTTTSDGTAWFANTTGSVSPAAPAGPAVPGQTVRVVFTRSGSTYTVEYLDARTETPVFDTITAVEDGNFAEELKLHVMAEVGTFEVTMIETGSGKYQSQTETSASVEVLTGTGWWDNNEASRDYTLSGDGYMVFEIYVNPDNDKASNAYCVEAYDDGQHYLTTTSDGTAWFANTTGSLSPVESTGPACPGQTVHVVFTRSGSTCTIEYLDALTGDRIFDKITAMEAGNFEHDLKLHVMAQVGTFEVTMIETGSGKYTKHLGAPESIVMDGMVRIIPEDRAYAAAQRGRVAVHDPSIVIGYTDEASYTGKEKVYGEQNDTGTRTKVYFIFGTLCACAYSTDLENWTMFSNNLNSDFREIFARESAWGAAGHYSYDISTRIWAPDVMWNPEYVNEDGSKGAWMMYVSIHGVLYNSSIALLTAGDIAGDWTYRGTVLFTGFTEKGTNHDYTQTDYLEYVRLDADGTLPDRYIIPEYTNWEVNENTTWNKYNMPSAIDPMVFYDEAGVLRLVYGSFAGGIYMLDLDPATGFRSSRAYPSDDNSSDGKASDPYCGIKLAGGGDTSVEGAYIKYINGRYYLFLSVGGCFTYTGYNMRVFSSENVEGPYTDYLGNKAFDSGPLAGKPGARLMFNYRWDWMKKAHIAQGHNSVYVDDDGDVFVIYHAKTDDGTDNHTVRVHQLFMTDSGAYAAAPFEYCRTDETDAVYSEEEIAGAYRVILHKTTDYANLRYNSASSITLNSDHTISGDHSGSWHLEDGTSEVTLSIDGAEYQGRFLKQTMEETNINALCFTAACLDSTTIPLWGVKLPGDADCVRLAVNNMPDVARVLEDGARLPTTGACGTGITWYCDSDCISEDGLVRAGTEDITVTLYAVVTRGEYYSVKCYLNRTINA